MRREKDLTETLSSQLQQEAAPSVPVHPKVLRYQLHRRHLDHPSTLGIIGLWELRPR